MTRTDNAMQEPLNASELDFFGMLNAIQSPIVLTDMSYRHLFRNRSFQNQMGYDFEEVYDRQSWFEKAFPDQKYRNETIRVWGERQAEAQAKKSPHFKLLTRICCQHNRHRWYEAHEYHFRNYKVITYINVDHVQKKTEKLLKIIRFNTVVQAAIAHDIRSPLATLKSLIQFELQKSNESQPKFSRVLTRLDNQINRIFDIIDSSVLHHGNELNLFRFKRQKISLNSLIEKIQSYYAEEMIMLGKRWIANITESLYVDYDRFILEVTIRNIVSNAIKHTPSFESIALRIEQTAQHTDIHIKDKGGGLTQEDLRYIADPLTYHHRSERDDIRMGFGIGLLLSKDLLESHWGTLIIKSNPPVGTTFIIRIPTTIPGSDP